MKVFKVIYFDVDYPDKTQEEVFALDLIKARSTANKMKAKHVITNWKPGGVAGSNEYWNGDDGSQWVHVCIEAHELI